MIQHKNIIAYIGVLLSLDHVADSFIESVNLGFQKKVNESGIRTLHTHTHTHTLSLSLSFSFSLYTCMPHYF